MSARSHRTAVRGSRTFVYLFHHTQFFTVCPETISSGFSELFFSLHFGSHMNTTLLHKVVRRRNSEAHAYAIRCSVFTQTCANPCKCHCKLRGRKHSSPGKENICENVSRTPGVTWEPTLSMDLRYKLRVHGRHCYINDL